MDINFLVKVASRAWSMNILAALAAGTPARQAPLLAATGAGRTAFAGSLTHLVQLGLLEKTPGHGHPLRPEYRLTDHGKVIARIAGDVMGAIDHQADAALIRRTWTLPVLAATQKPRYFSEIKVFLPRVTDRALAQSLRHLEDRRWLQREVDVAQRPVRPTYLAVDLGARLGAVL